MGEGYGTEQGTGVGRGRGEVVAKANELLSLLVVGVIFFDSLVVAFAFLYVLRSNNVIL